MNFEENLEKLNAIVKRFENEKLSIVESVKLYEEGIAISAEAMTCLRDTNEKVKRLKCEMEQLFTEDFI